MIRGFDGETYDRNIRELAEARVEIERLRAEVSKWETTSMCEASRRQEAEDKYKCLRDAMLAEVERLQAKRERGEVGE
jgi:hypothetical protein